MELIRGIHNLKDRHKPCVATLGAFDGIHLGHQTVLAGLVEKAKEMGLPSVVVMFEPLPREYFSPEKAPARLQSFRENFSLLAELGIDRVFRIRFDENLSHMSAEDFIQQVFVDGLGVKYMVIGDDLRFGRDRVGSFALLQQAGKEFGFDVESTETFTKTGKRVSSTRIRQALLDDEFDLAETLLGRPYSIRGRVVKGAQLGRELGMPTANLLLRRRRAPMAGVYAVEVAGLGDELLRGVANVGTRPTVSASSKAILEVHLFDFDRDIYGQEIEVIFRKKIRDEQKFAELELLKTQIHKDAQQSRAFFETQR